MIAALPEQRPVFASTSEESKKIYPFQRGQRIIYEEEEAEIIRITPLLVIRTRNRVVCGALQNRFATEMI